MNIVGKRIRERREFLRLSQEELAQLTGYKSKSAISRIESENDLNSRKLKFKKIKTFAKVLNTTPEYLMGWTNNPDLTREQDKNTQILAADTASLDGKAIIIASDTIDKTQQHRNALADKIRNSDYTNEQLDKIEKMIELMI